MDIQFTEMNIPDILEELSEYEKKYGCSTEQFIKDLKIQCHPNYISDKFDMFEWRCLSRLVEELKEESANA